MKPLLLALSLALAAPVAAEEPEEPCYAITALGQQWHLIKQCEPVTLAPGEARRIIVYLDDVPGGVAGAPVVVARPMTGDKAALTLSPAVFAPVAMANYPVPLVGVILRNDSAEVVSYRVKVYVQGRE